MAKAEGLRVTSLPVGLSGESPELGPFPGGLAVFVSGHSECAVVLRPSITLVPSRIGPYYGVDKLVEGSVAEFWAFREIWGLCWICCC